MDKILWIIKNALREDMPRGDISSDHLFDEQTASARLIAKEDGILSGMAACRKTFLVVDPKTHFEILIGDGEPVKKGSIIATVHGLTKSLLKAERVALNLVQRMSGIATLTRRFVEQTQGTNAKILDTRKTTPNLRVLEKLAVLDGGGQNHRMNLSEMVMLKDNHIHAVGSIREAVAKVKRKIPETVKIEVEVESIPMFLEAIETACDIIMLDNMTTEAMFECVKQNQGKKILEASGNMALERIHEVAMTGVDWISVGMLTHSYKSLDISMKF